MSKHTGPRLERAVAAIRRGGVVAYPTEGVYGMGCDPRQRPALERLIAMKGRDAAKGLIVVAGEWSAIESLVQPLSPRQRERVLSTWPGPVTWVMPAAAHLDELVTGARATVAVRVSAHPIVAALCRACGHALVSTSANPSGSSPLLSASAVRSQFGDAIDTIVDGALGGLAGPTPIYDIQSGARLR